MRSAVVLTVLAALVISASAACSDPPPPKTPQKDDGVPANSLSDARLHGEDEKSETGGTDDTKTDPTQPYTTKVGEAPPPEPTGPGAKPSSGKEPSGGGKGVVSRSECDRVMDKYLELEIARNPQLKGVPPEVIEQAKQMAREKHGDAPCTATRAQYSCAMAASSTAAWQRCMK